MDNTGLPWTTGGSANWFGQTTTFYSSGDAAQSGAVADNQTTWLETTVSGPGTLSFYWTVSSESGKDFLAFYIDSAEQASISGPLYGPDLKIWIKKSYLISSGSHTLRWQYTKDSTTSFGGDSGWVDNVVFTP